MRVYAPKQVQVCPSKHTTAIHAYTYIVYIHNYTYTGTLTHLSVIGQELGFLYIQFKQAKNMHIAINTYVANSYKRLGLLSEIYPALTKSVGPLQVNLKFYDISTKLLLHSLALPVN